MGADMSTYVGGHPVAGRERSGPAAAHADLFIGRPWVITAPGGRPERDRGRDGARRCRAVPSRCAMTADAHDAALADGLAPSAHRGGAAGRPAWQAPTTRRRLGGTGFQDTTRVAAATLISGRRFWLPTRVIWPALCNGSRPTSKRTVDDLQRSPPATRRDTMRQEPFAAVSPGGRVYRQTGDYRPPGLSPYRSSYATPRANSRRCFARWATPGSTSRTCGSNTSRAATRAGCRTRCARGRSEPIVACMQKAGWEVYS